MSEKAVIAYLCHEYPKYSETFVYREIDRLRDEGLEIAVLAMKRAVNAASVENGEEKTRRAKYLAPDFSAHFVIAQIEALVRSPLRYVGLFMMMIFGAGRGSEAPIKVRLGFLMRGALAARMLRKIAGVRYIHCPATGHELIAAHAASVLTGIPVGFTLHSPIALFIESPLLGVHARHATFVAAISEDARKRLIKISGDSIAQRVKVVHCGIDLPPEPTPADKTDPVVLAVGSLWTKKGHDTLVKAMGVLRKRGVNATCRIVGEGAERPNLEALIANLGLQDVVKLLGPKPPEFVREAVSQCRVSVLACRVNEQKDRDGIPVALMEAMAGARPCVSTTVSGIPELIAHNETGFLVEPDDPEALADAIAKFIASPALAREMGEKGRKRIAKEFSLTDGARNLKREFNRITHTIAYISHEFPKITETFVGREIESLEKIGARVVVYSFKRSRSAKPGVIYLQDLGLREWIATIKLILRKPVAAAQLLIEAWRAGRYSDAWRPGPGAVADVFRGALIASSLGANVSGIHASFASVTATAARAASILTGIPFGFTSHSSPPDALLKQKCESARWIFSESDFDSEFLCGIAGNDARDKISVVRCGITSSDIASPDPNDARYTNGRALFVGSLGPKKGVIPLMRAIAALHNEGVDIRIDVVGDGPLKYEMKAILDEAGAANNARFLGEVVYDDLKNIYASARLLVLPSIVTPEGDRDGIPVTLIEAMASGLPCVSTTVSGIPELIEDGVTGLLVTPNDVGALKAALSKLWNDAAVCSRMGAAGREKAMRMFDTNAESSKTKEALERVGVIDGDGGER